MKLLSLLIAAFALVLTQCERHSWEDVTDEHGHLTEKGTKRLFEEHGGHDQKADAHGKDGSGDKAPEPVPGDGGTDH